MDEVDAKYRPPLELDLIKKEKKPIQTFMVGTAEACIGKDKTEESVWASNWDSDEEFGRQALNGALPGKFSILRRHPFVKNVPLYSIIL